MRICLSCGCTPHVRPINRLPLAMSPDLGLCIGCGDKYQRRGVRTGIQRESDRLLTEHKEAFLPYMPKATCGHCGEPVLLDNQGAQPLLCQACDRRRMQVAKGVK